MGRGHDAIACDAGGGDLRPAWSRQKLVSGNDELRYHNDFQRRRRRRCHVQRDKVWVRRPRFRRTFWPRRSAMRGYRFEGYVFQLPSRRQRVRRRFRACAGRAAVHRNLRGQRRTLRRRRPVRRVQGQRLRSRRKGGGARPLSTA